MLIEQQRQRQMGNAGRSRLGQTLTQGDPVLRYDQASGVLDFLTPPPRQAERAALITGEQLKPWAWKLDSNAYAVIAALMGYPG